MVNTYDWGPNSLLVLVRIVLSEIGANSNVYHEERDHY